jgi:RIO-like serine/threonine protein kinase
MKPKHLTRSQAKELLRKISEDLKYFKPIKDKDSFCNPCTFVNDYVVRQVNPIWPDKAEAEVCAINFARKIGIPAPEIIWWDKNFIIMKRIHGKPLSLIWKNLEKKAKRVYMKQIVGYVELMQKNKFNKIGSLYLKGIGKNVNVQKGPYKRFDDFILDEYDKNVGDIKDISKQVFIEFRKRIKGYAPRVRFVFTHGDLGLKNILVAEGKIAGIIDWEWAGSYPPVNDSEEISGYCDKDIIQNSKLRKKYPKKLMDILYMNSYAMCAAYYKSWNIKKECRYIKEIERKAKLIR